MTEMKLKNGSMEVDKLIAVVTLVLNRLMDGEVAELLALWDLRHKAEDNRHVVSGKSAELLSHLFEDESCKRMHGSIRNIVLSSVVLDGTDIKLVDPIDRKAMKEIKDVNIT